MNKSIAILILLGISCLPAAATDIGMSLRTYSCVTTPSVHESANWTNTAGQPTCNWSDIFTQGGSGVKSCVGSYEEIDTALPHGQCHVVRDWAPDLSITMNSSCTSPTSQEWYIVSEYQY